MSSGENGRLAGRYRIVRQLGRGGMGVVWRAVDEVLGREVAVKELRTYTDAAAPELADLRLRMTREARAAARVRHPGVVAVHDVTEHEGRPVIVMELVEGPSLADVLGERGTVDPAEAARIGAHVLEALAAAHDVGVLHRDVKPGNILLDASGRIVLTDFGIATMEDPGDGSATHLTRSGEIVGSLDFLAPERAQGQDPGPASDVWAVGATLYAAVEGSSPFRRTSTWSTLAAIVTEPLPEPVRAGPLTPLLLRLLDKDPAARPTAREAARLLGAVGEAAASGGAPEHEGAEAGALAPEAPAPNPYAGPVEPNPYAGAFGPPVPVADPVPVPAPVPVPPVRLDAGVGTGGRAAARRAGAKPRRGNVLVAAAVAAVLLAGGGITYALMDHDSGAQAAGETPQDGDRGGAATGGDAGRVLDPGSSAAPSGRPSGSATPSAGPTPSGRESGAAAGGAPATDGPGSDGSDPGSAAGGSEAGGAGSDTASGASGGGGGTKDPGTTDGGTATAGGTSSTTGGTSTTGGSSGGGTTAAPTTEAPPPASGCTASGSSATCQVVRSATTTRYDGGEMGTVGAGPHTFYCQVDLDRTETYGGTTSRWFARTDDDSGNTNVYLSVLHLSGGAGGGPVAGLRIC
ncbi:serine/threonine-protein kinase [Streptomyces sp. NRRL B-24572]|uniref:serine/threonine-protein kinase n=1 Tax=Streptomyces sp. NRRL B-24572 TaxID=1962156 RepID=UPI000A3A288B|nr:serine/threonine-protein kinase [Streptomyces sp. NRRL B-24572]